MLVPLTSMTYQLYNAHYNGKIWVLIWKENTINIRRWHTKHYYNGNKIWKENTINNMTYQCHYYNGSTSYGKRIHLQNSLFMLPLSQQYCIICQHKHKKPLHTRTLAPANKWHLLQNYYNGNKIWKENTINTWHTKNALITN